MDREGIIYMKKKENKAAGNYVSRERMQQYKADAAFARRMLQMNAMRRICGGDGFSNTAVSIGRLRRFFPQVHLYGPGLALIFRN